MLILKIVSILLGLAFGLFGYFIYFRKKYSLINGFEADLKAGRKTELYAKRVGLIEFIFGIALFFCGDSFHYIVLTDSFVDRNLFSYYN